MRNEELWDRMYDKHSDRMDEGHFYHILILHLIVRTIALDTSCCERTFALMNHLCDFKRLLRRLGAAAQRRWLELRTLRLGDGSLLPAPCRRARYRACGGVARLSELRVRGAPLLSAQLIHVLTTGELARKSAGLSCGIGRLVASRRHNCA